jgi:hypothetical protein
MMQARPGRETPLLLGGLVALAVVGSVSAEEPDAVPAEIQRAIQDGVRALFGVPQPAVDIDAANQQVQVQARQFEQFLQPLLRTELEVIRQACPTLVPDARQRILEAGRQAVRTIAREWAVRQARAGGTGGAADPRSRLQELLAPVVTKHAAAAEAAAYDRELAARGQRRAEAARIAIVSVLDGPLDLTAAQREAILVDLRGQWKDSWARILSDSSRTMMINNRRPAPDFADACIVPHLDERQRDEWRSWSRAAGARAVLGHDGWRFDGQGLQRPDPWWGN